MIAVWYPESMLISHVQVLRATKLYREIKEAPVETLKEDQLVKYLKSIPEEIFEEL